MTRCKLSPLCFAIGSAFLAAGLGLTALPAEAHEVTIDPIVFFGDPVLGTEPGTVHGLMNVPVLNHAGQVAFLGHLTGPNVNTSNSSAIWVADQGSVELIARGGDPAPGTELGVMFFNMGFDSLTFTSTVLNDSGHVIFGANLVGEGVDHKNHFGIWSNGSGVLELIARDDRPAPGAGAGVVFVDLRNEPILNNAGQTAFRASLSGAGVTTANDTGIWSQGSGVLGLVAREGDAAPGTGAGVVFGNLNGSVNANLAPVLNNAGQVAFRGRLTGVGVDASNDVGIWSQGRGTLELIARAGDAAPGTGPGVVFGVPPEPILPDNPILNNPVLNNAGQLAFQAFLAGTGVDSTNDTGIWSNRNGTLDLVVRAGDAAPGTEAGTVFSTLTPRPTFNGAGQIAFTGTVSGPSVDGSNNRGVWSEGNGNLALIAREGDVAPGTGPGVVFSSFSAFPALNGNGQVAFGAALDGDGVDGSNNLGVFATDIYGTLRLIAREGEVIDVNEDPLIEDLRTIALVGLENGSSGEDGRALRFNDNGQVVFQLFFTDNTLGIFRATLSNGLQGDVNGDQFVGVEDLDILLANWGDAVGTGIGGLTSGDLSGDGVVGQADLDILLDAWGDGTPPNVNIPEPSSFAMLTSAGLTLIRRRRSQKRSYRWA